MTESVTRGLATNSALTQNTMDSRGFSPIRLAVFSVATLWELDGSVVGEGASTSMELGEEITIVGEDDREKGAKIRYFGAAAK